MERLPAGNYVYNMAVQMTFQTRRPTWPMSVQCPVAQILPLECSETCFQYLLRLNLISKQKKKKKQQKAEELVDNLACYVCIMNEPV